MSHCFGGLRRNLSCVVQRAFRAAYGILAAELWHLEAERGPLSRCVGTYICWWGRDFGLRANAGVGCPEMSGCSLWAYIVGRGCWLYIARIRLAKIGQLMSNFFLCPAF